MGKQSAGAPVAPVPSGGQAGKAPPNAGPAPQLTTVSPAVRRVREGPAAAQGHGGGK